MSARRGRHDELTGAATVGHHGCDVGACQLSGMLGDTAQQGRLPSSRKHVVGDLAEGVQPPLAGPNFFVQRCIGDCDAGLSSKHHQGVLVFLTELVCGPLLGEVDVAENAAHGLDRCSQERSHRRVIGREPHRLRVIGDVIDAHRPRLVNQQPEHSPTARKIPDRLSLPGRDPGRNEFGNRVSVADDAKGAIAGVGNLCRQVHDSLEHDRQRKF